MIGPRHEKALQQLATLLRPTEFLLGGSAMLAARGAAVAVNDLDLMVASHDRPAVEAVLGPGVEPETPGPVVSDWLLRTEVEGVDIDVLGGVSVVVGKTRWRLPMRADGVVTVGDSTVSLCALGPWFVLYSHSDSAKAEVARGLLGPEGVAEALGALGGSGIE